MKAFCVKLALSHALLGSPPLLSPSKARFPILTSLVSLSTSSQVVPSPLQPLRSLLNCQQLARQDACLRKDTLSLTPTVRVMAVAADSPPPGYRANVGVCLINSNNEVFVASRIDLPDSWQMPQGGVDEDEDPRAAAIRELKEETGVTSAEIIDEVPGWLTYDFPPDVKAKVTQLWGKEWTGQAQRWFLFRFTGGESEIDLNGDGIDRAEFCDWKWLPVEEVIQGAVEFKKPVYEHVFKSFGPVFKSKNGIRGASL